MTIAAKLSRKLYETFGDEAAETMVDWMQTVDAHRAELRELNDMAFDRFDARLGERLADFRLEFRQELHAGLSDVRKDLQAGLSDVRKDLHTEISKLSERLEQRYADLFKWSFGFWIGSVVTLMLGMAAIERIGR